MRLTIRVDESNVSEAVLATLHEGGHGLYDQGFDHNDRGTLLAEAPSMGLQESQARLWENHIGRARAFWDYALPSLQKLFPEAADGVDAEPFYRSVNLVRPGVNRVAADEVSYHLHIVLRYELEVALISDSLSIRDLPQVWNESSTSLIGQRLRQTAKACFRMCTGRSACSDISRPTHWAAFMRRSSRKPTHVSIPSMTKSAAANSAACSHGCALTSIVSASV